MSLSSNLNKKAGKDLQNALEQIDFLQNQIVIVDSEKLPYDQAIAKLDQDLINQCDEVNEAFNDVETAYNNRIVGVCRTDLFWRVINYTEASGDDDGTYHMVCTKLTAGGYEELTKGGVIGLGNTVKFVNSNGTLTTYPCNKFIQNELGLGVGYTFGFDPRNYYGLKYYNEPYSDDIGDTFVGSFIGTITQGESTLTVMQPVGLGLSEKLKVGQLIVPEVASVFSGVTKITGITTGKTNLTRIVPLNEPVGIATTLSWVNIITVDNTALQTLKAPLDDGTYPDFEVLDDPDNFADQGREQYSLDKELDPFLPQTVGIMQTSTVGTGISVALDNSGYPTAAIAWDPNLEGYVVEYSSRGVALAGPVQAPKVGSGQCFWKVGFIDYPILSGGARATEGATRSVDDSQINNVYGTLSQGSSCTTLDTAVTDAVGIASALETSLRAVNLSTNATKVDGLNSLRAERNDDYSLPIWGMRVGIGAQNEIVTRLQILQGHLDDLTIRNVVDA